MAKIDTMGRLLVDAALPPEVPRPAGALDAKTIRAVFQSMAELRPDKYRESAKALTDLAARAGYETGGFSFGPEHLRPTPEVRAAQDQFRKSVRLALLDPDLTDKARNDRLVRVALEHMQPLQDAVVSSTRAADNPLYHQVASGAKGKPENLTSLLAGDTLYNDSEYRPVPFPVTSSFYDGLAPHEYYGGTFGARLAITLTKLGTAKGGYASKRLKNVTHRLVVSARDAEHTDPADPPTGLKVPLADPDNEGAVLARDAGGYPRNTILSRKVLGDLRSRGIDAAFVRSPMVGGPADGGVYSLDAGVREKRRLAPVGDQVGIAAADSVSEPMTQSIIGSKHTGGVAGGTKAQEGFPVMDRMISIPADYQGATHAETDGMVGRVADAPHGGKYVSVDGTDHYVRPEYAVTVKSGDKVEAGDPLSEGHENPAKYVEHKGIGEARKRFVDVFMRAANAAGFRPHRRNLELVARGLIDHVRVDQETEDHAPGDVVSYTSLAADYRPRPGHARLAPAEAVGKYLERPALHYSIGTRITPRVAADLESGGVGRVPVHAEPPPFTPVMVRSNDAINHDPDPVTRMLGSGLEKHLLRGAVRGDTIDPLGTSWASNLAQGEHVGLKGKTVGWNPAET